MIKIYNGDLCFLVENEALIKKQFHFIEAAGGIIENEKGEILLMYRRKSWDLPKGKIDKEESPLEAAKREILEETGVKNLTLIDSLPSTYHIYPYKQKQALKKTYWFYFKTDEIKTVPQADEDIELIEWVAVSQLGRYQSNIHLSLKDLLTVFVEKRFATS